MRRGRGLRPLLLLVLLLAGVAPSAAVYDLPNNDAGCPANCRQIPWLAGADTWNGTGTPGSGTLPVYTAVACTAGLTEGDGTTDNTTAIQTCLNALSANQATVLPAGIFYVNGVLQIASQKVLRGAGSVPCAQGRWLSATYHGDTGAGATCTTLKFGPGGSLRNSGSGGLGAAVALASGYTKGSTSLVTSAGGHGVVSGDWVIIAQLQGSTDPPVTWTGDNGVCDWCGMTDGVGDIMTQIVQVTNVSGNTLTLSRPLYYTFQSTFTPRLKELTLASSRVGVEHLKLWGASTSRTEPHLTFSRCAFCWAKSVETYDTPNVGKAYPIYLEQSYGVELRDSYFHFGRGNGADRNYGTGMFGPNSDHKIENNIYRENRHAVSIEGGGSGIVVLYNYIDDQWTDDLTYLANATLSHGAHPYMTLVEGNIIQHLVADDVWGSSSHGVLFRNWLWGDTSGQYSGFTTTDPNWGFAAVEIAQLQTYYSLVGNVLGRQGGHVTWSGGTVFTAACGWNSSRTQPRVYGLGCTLGQTGPYQANVRSSTILHRNYDYKTLGVAFDDGGADLVLKNSMYYPSKPAWFGTYAWPVFGPEPTLRALPARDRFNGVPAPTSSPGFFLFFR